MTLSGRLGGARWTFTLLQFTRRAPRGMQPIEEGEPIEYVGIYQSEYLTLDLRRGDRRYCVRLYRYAREVDCGPSLRFWWGKRKWPRRVLWGKPPIITPEGAELRDKIIERQFAPAKHPPAPESLFEGQELDDK